MIEEVLDGVTGMLKSTWSVIYANLPQIHSISGLFLYSFITYIFLSFLRWLRSSTLHPYI